MEEFILLPRARGLVPVAPVLGESLDLHSSIYIYVFQE